METSKKKKFKRLFFDIETSPNLVFSWNVGRKLNIDHDNIFKERAIICICWKWEGEKKVHYLSWNKGDDKKMLIDFIKVMHEADEIVGHNSDQFDIKWIRTRCIYHGIPVVPDFVTLDTLKLSRRGFRFNSNRLDYIGKFLKLGRKKDTGGFGLWKNIIINNNEISMNKMVSYCKQDVSLLEDIYHKLEPYVGYKTHIGVHNGGSPHSCPCCTSTHVISNGSRISANGIRKARLHCQNCGKYYQISSKQLDELKNSINSSKH